MYARKSTIPQGKNILDYVGSMNRAPTIAIEDSNG